MQMALVIIYQINTGNEIRFLNKETHFDKRITIKFGNITNKINNLLPAQQNPTLSNLIYNPSL